MTERLKEKLILRRLDKVYCRLGPSSVHGVGIFAIKDIPLGTNPFNNSYMAQESILVNAKKIPEVYKGLLNDYHPNLEQPDSQIVSLWPNQPIWTNYLNYSGPTAGGSNIELAADGEWKTLRNIRTGEELLENPNNLFNENGTRKTYLIIPGQYPNLN
jgi:hypothetical protein